MKNNLILLKRFFSFILSMFIFMSVFLGTGIPVKAAMVTRGETIDYSSYIPGGSWQTHRYYIDGNLAYCVQSELAQVNDGDYQTIVESFDTYPLLCKVLFYGYGGPAYKMGEFFSGYGISLTEEQAYLYTHIAANYAYGGNVWHGLDEPTAEALHLTDWIKYCSNNVCLPENKHLTGGIVKIATPEGAQRIAYLDSYTFEDLNVSVEVKINFDKTKNTYGDATTHNAVYGLFDSADTELQRITLSIPAGSTTASGNFTYTFDTDGTYYVKEITAPTGYTLDTTKYYFTVDTSAQSATSSDTHFASVNSRELTFTKNDEIPVKGYFTFIKIDSSGNPLSGAEFDVYLQSALLIKDGKYDFSSATPVCARLSSDASGTVTSPELDYGIYVVHEAVVPTGKLPMDDFLVGIFSSSETVSLGGIIDGSIRGKFTFKKTDSNGQALSGASFDVYLKSDLKVSGGKYDFSGATPVCGRITSNSAGIVTSPELDYGTYVVHEAVVPKGKVPIDDFEVSILSSDTVSLVDKVDKTIRGKFTFKKKDANGKALSGAGFDVYLKSDLKVSGGKYDFTGTTPVCGRLTSNSSGKVTSPELDYGTYVVHEAVVPKGKLPIDDFEVSIVSSDTLSLVDKVDKTIRGKFTFKKTDDSGKALSGAGFDVYLKSDLKVSGGKYDFSSATPVCGRLTSNSSGKVTSPELDYGTYIVHEVVVPKGKLPIDDFEVNILSSDTVSIVDKADKNIRGKFTFKKTDSNGQALSGAGFDVYLKTDLKVSEGKYDFSDAKPVCGRLTSNSSGVVTSPELDYGTYIVHEAVVPQGKLAVDDFEISIVNNGETVKIKDKTDKTIQGKFSLEKTGDDGLPIKGAGFSAYEKSSLTLNSDGTYDFSSATPVTITSSGDTVLKTDENGKAVSAFLDYGTYVVCESVVPKGYKACEPFEVKIENHNVTVDVGNVEDTVVPAKFKIIKKDSESKEIIRKGGAKFKIYDVQKDVYVSLGGVETFTTDDTGMVTTTAPLSLGTYRIEEVEAPEGYLLDSTPVEIVFDSTWPYTMEGTDKIITAEFENTPKKGRVEIIKTGKGLTGFVNNKFVWTDVNLYDAVYEIHAAEDIYSPDNSGKMIHEKNDLIGTLTTDSSGFAAMDNLYLGKYYLMEVTAPTGYVIDNTHKIFELSYNDSSATPIISLNSFYDEKQNIILQLTKTDSETKKPLSGAEFGIYAEENIYSFDGTPLISSGELITKAVSDSNGIIDFGLDLPYAKYMVKEIKAPVNYVLNQKEFIFTAVYPASDVKEVSFMNSWENTPVRGSLEITKEGESLTDFKNGEFIWENKPLKGAEFNVFAKEDIYTFDNSKGVSGKRSLYYRKNQLIETITTGEDGKAKTSNLPVGNYYLVETASPYGMIIDTAPIDFSIEYKDQNTALVLSTKSILNERQKISLKVTKLETGSDKNLSGGKFNLYADADIKNINGEVIAPKGTLISQTEAKEGKVDFGLDLPHAVYKITEEKAPSDYYENDEEYAIDLSYTDSTIKNLTAELSIYDTRLPHFAKVMMKVKPAFKSKSKSNYITEDNGEGGYSILLISDGTTLPVSTTSNMWFCLFASSILLLAGSFITMFILIKRKRERRKYE